MKISTLLHVLLCLPIVLLVGCVSQSPSSMEISTPIAITYFPSMLKLDNIDIEFIGYEFQDHDLSIVICFKPLSDGDWFFGNTNLKIGDQEFQNSGVSRNPEPDREAGFECETIIYDVSNSVIPSGKAELTIGRLGRHLNIDERDCKTAQEHLDEAKTGIVVKCDPAIPGVFTVSKQPVSMSDEAAFLLANDAFSYSEAIPLNWKFSFLIEKP
jgi:hypothetical protein